MPSVPTPSVQGSWDGPGFLGAGSDGLFLRWNNATGKFEVAAAGVTDHGALTGLGDDDHSVYALLAGRAGGQTLTGGTGSANDLTLTATSHATQGRILSGALTVTSPAAATVGQIIKLAASQTASALEVQNSAGAVLVRVDSAGKVRGAASNDGYLAFGTNAARIGAFGVDVLGIFSAPSVCVDIAGTGPGNVVFMVKGAASQVSNLQEWRNSAGAVQMAVGPTGQLKTNGTSANANTPSGATAAQWPIYNAAGELVGYAPIYAAPW